MPGDLQVGVAERVRAAGVVGEATLRMPDADARRLIAGFYGIDADSSNVDSLDRYPPFDDGRRLIGYALDDAMPRGSGPSGGAVGYGTPASLDGLTS